jgi:hypothetical protein
MTLARLALALLLVAGCGGARYKSAAGAPVPAGARVAVAGDDAAVANAAAQVPEELVIEGFVRLEVEDVPAAAAAIRIRVEEAGGRITSENLDGAAEAWTGGMKIRIPPGALDAMWIYFEELGEIRTRRVTSTDVSKVLYDQAIQLENLTLTLDRLRKLLEGEGLKMTEVLEIEKEMTRLRGEIERIKGERRFLKDRVAHATIDLTLERRQGAVLSPSAKIYPGPRAALLTLVGERDGRARNRVGFGVAIQFPGESRTARSNLELDVFDDADGDGSAVLGTLGVAVYSDFLGGGRNRFLNPYIGFRIGYGYLDGSRFAAGASVGIELFKHERAMIEANVRGLALIGETTDTVMVTGLGAVFAF